MAPYRLARWGTDDDPWTLNGSNTGSGNGSGGAPSAGTALAAATGYTNQANSALRSASGAAGTMRNYAGGLYSTGTGLMSQYNSAFAPAINQLPGMANIPLQTYVDEAANAMRGQFDRSRGILQRQAAGMGVNAASGRFQGLMASLARNEAAASAGAMTSARNQGREANFNRMLGVAGVGQNLLGQGVGAMQSAGGLMGQAAGIYGSLGSQYGGLANQAGAYGAYQNGLAPAAQPPAAGAQGAAAAGTAAGATTPATQVPRYLSNEAGDNYRPATAGAMSVGGGDPILNSGYPVWYGAGGSAFGVDDSGWNY